MPQRRFLFLQSSARAAGNSAALARLAAEHLPADTVQDWRDLSSPAPVSYTHLDVYKRQAVWLARPSGGREVESSNLSGPTIIKTARRLLGLAGGSVSNGGK